MLCLSSISLAMAFQSNHSSYILRECLVAGFRIHNSKILLELVKFPVMDHSAAKKKKNQELTHILVVAY